MPYVACTAVWNVCSNPAASVPAGFAPTGLPLAVQLVAAPHDGQPLLAVAAHLERTSPWAERLPQLP